MINNIIIDYSVTAYGNINKQHRIKKKHCVKREKTVLAGELAVNNVKKKHRFELEKKKQVDYKYIDKEYWFEQFYWFISSDGYLVICGKNAQQNELIVKKYMDKNDMYIHGDFHGSGSCIVKNNSGNEIPLSTLIQAGNFVSCNSSGWKKNITDKTYYVKPEQVTKTAPSGEYISTGGFMIRGKKNYLSESILELGVGLLFIKEENDGQFYENLTFNPENENIIGCIPVKAPYSSVLNYKFKVKLKPGKMRLNRIISNVNSCFYGKKGISDIEKYMMKKISNDRYINLQLNNSCVFTSIKR